MHLGTITAQPASGTVDGRVEAVDSAAGLVANPLPNPLV
jgi:hypothetical protein